MNKKLINLREISDARGFIYGISILWIVFYHCALNVSRSFLQTVKLYGDCAVEVFFFMSGCSLYFSFVKRPHALNFYKKRLKRVLPYYLVFYGIVFTIFNLIISFNPLQFFINYTMLDFWLHGLGNSPWFLAAIIVFYLAYPLIYNLFFKDYRLKKLWIIISSVVLSAVCVVSSVFCPHLRIFIYRIPIFLIGCLFGKFVYEGRDLKFYQFLVLICALILGRILFAVFGEISIFRNIYYLPLSLMIVFLLSQLYKFNNCYFKALNKPFEFLGMFTLEIYLTHEKVQENLLRILNSVNIGVTFENQIYQLVCIVLAIMISVGLASLIKYIGKQLNRENEG